MTTTARNAVLEITDLVQRVFLLVSPTHLLGHQRICWRFRRLCSVKLQQHKGCWTPVFSIYCLSFPYGRTYQAWTTELDSCAHMPVHGKLTVLDFVRPSAPSFFGRRADVSRASACKEAAYL